MTHLVSQHEIPRFAGANPDGPWVVLNCAVTQILGRYDTEGQARMAAEWFGNASFPYELSADETAEKESSK